MAVKIRLSRLGKKDSPFYRIVVVEKRTKRDGKHIAKIGYFDQTTKPGKVKVDKTALNHWLKVGAKPTETVRKILKIK